MNFLNVTLKLLHFSKRGTFCSRRTLSLSGVTLSASNVHNSKNVGGNNFVYEEVVKDFQWKIPEYWNFAQVKRYSGNLNTGPVGYLDGLKTVRFWIASAFGLRLSFWIICTFWVLFSCNVSKN